MKKLLQLAVGIVSGIGGFLEIGTITTAAEAGASFRYDLLWTVIIGTICLIFLLEMSGRLAAISKRTLLDAVRERFGFPFSVFPRLAELITNLLVLAAEIGGVALSLQLVTGISYRWWTIPVALTLWATLWAGTLSVIENSTSILGMITLVFLVAAVRIHPDTFAVLRGTIPSLPHKDGAHFWFTAVSIIGATISPYTFAFYSSCAVEDAWGEDDLVVNRVNATLGMSFGALLSIAVVVLAAHTFAPAGITVDRFEQLPLLLVPVLGKWGVPLFAAAAGVACFGAAIELALGSAYMTAQTVGWNWGENAKPREKARFSVFYTVLIAAAALFLVTGIDPLKLTMFSMAVTALTLPLIALPFLLLMNDENYVGEHRNGWIGNSVVVFVMIVASILAVVTIPLEIAGGH